MQLIWHGHSFFQIVINSSKDKEVVLAIDPFSESIGLKPARFPADILLISHHHADHNNVKTIEGHPFLIDGPGEYEVRGVYVQGIPAFHDKSLGKERGQNTIFTIEAEGLRVCHLGDLGQKELFPEQIEDIGEIDVLLVPVGGTYTLGPEEAPKIIAQIEPKIIIPMHYQLPKLNLKLEGVDKFLKAMGKKAPEPLGKLNLKKKDLPGEETTIVVLKAV